MTKRLNPKTNKLFQRGDIREDGYKFICYRTNRINKNTGYATEEWCHPDKYVESLKETGKPLISFDSYLKRFKEIHGNKYDYSNSETTYIDGSTEISIICKKHGVFFVVPSDHASKRLKRGCKYCSKEEQRSDTEEFIKKGTALFGKRYDYSESEYITAIKPIKIKCRKHGVLKNMTPNKHLRREGGCMKCAKEKAQKKYVMPIEEFIIKSNLIHQKSYDYSKTKQFKNQHDKLTIICNECGNTFQQTANSHIQGKGCNIKACVGKKITEANLLTYSEIVDMAIKTHGPDRYSYKDSVYEGHHIKIKIFCNLCNKYFFQTPSAHIHQSQGCPTCSDEIRILGDTARNLKKKNIFIEGNLYVIECYSDKESFFKIGVSVRKTYQRYSGTKLPYDFEIIAELPIGLIEAYLQERYILEQYERYSYKPDKYFKGHTECLSVNPIEVDERLKEIYNSYYE